MFLFINVAAAHHQGAGSWDLLQRESPNRYLVSTPRVESLSSIWDQWCGFGRSTCWDRERECFSVWLTNDWTSSARGSEDKGHNLRIRSWETLSSADTCRDTPCPITPCPEHQHGLLPPRPSQNPNSWQLIPGSPWTKSVFRSCD